MGPWYGPLIWNRIYTNYIPHAKQGPIEQTPPESKGPTTKAHRKTLGLGLRNWETALSGSSTVNSKQLEHGCRMISAGCPPFFGLGLEDGHAPTLRLLLYNMVCSIYGIEDMVYNTNGRYSGIESTVYSTRIIVYNLWHKV